MPPPIVLKVHSPAPAQAAPTAAADAAAADATADAAAAGDSGVSVTLVPRSYDFNGKLYMPAPAPSEGDYRAKSI